MLPPAMMGEGSRADAPPHPFFCAENPRRPLPQGERAQAAARRSRRERAITIAREECAARRGCARALFFFLFRPVIAAAPGEAKRGRGGDFFFCSSRLAEMSGRHVVARMRFFKINRKIQARRPAKPQIPQHCGPLSPPRAILTCS